MDEKTDLSYLKSQSQRKLKKKSLCGIRWGQADLCKVKASQVCVVRPDSGGKKRPQKEKRRNQILVTFKLKKKNPSIGNYLKY